MANVPIVEQMAGALAKLLADREFAAKLSGVGVEPHDMPPEPFAQFVRADIPVWTEHARVAGIEPQ